MKICYIADIGSDTGYSQAAKRTIESLHSVGANLVVRPFKLANQNFQPADPIKSLLDKDLQGVTHVVQHTLPPYWIYQAGVKNIGYFHWETDDLTPSGWQYYLELMDEIWVSCHDNYLAALRAGVTKPIKIVPIPSNPRSQLVNDKLVIPNFRFNDAYKFYHIGDYSSRKNTMTLLKCYLEEFRPDDNVVLIMKTYIEGDNAHGSMEKITQDINNLKISLRKGGNDVYPHIVLITNYLTETDLFKLHNLGDCHVTLERASAFTIPAYDAYMAGNWNIACQEGGHKQFLRDDENCNLVGGHESTVYGMTRTPYHTLYTAHEKWFEPNPEFAKFAMRDVYNKRKRLADKPALQIEDQGKTLMEQL